MPDDFFSTRIRKVSEALAGKGWTLEAMPAESADQIRDFAAREPIEFDLWLERRLNAVEERISEIEDSASSSLIEPCGTCGGSPHASGRVCVCGGVGTQAAEVEGLRRALFDAELLLGRYPNIPAPEPTREELADALEWAARRFKEALGRTPIRDATECLACADSLLARMGRKVEP